MDKVLNYENRKVNRGITLIEAIVSLGILVVVSLATVSIAIFSNTSFQSKEVKQYFSHELDNIAKLYLSYDETDFKQSVESSFGLVLSGSGYVDSTFYFDNSYNVLPNETGYEFKTLFDFETNSLSLSTYSKQNKLIYSRSVNK